MSFLENPSVRLPSAGRDRPIGAAQAPRVLVKQWCPWAGCPNNQTGTAQTGVCDRRWGNPEQFADIGNRV